MKKKILIISDTHSYLGDEIISYAKKADEVWHAGDIGDYTIIEELRKHAFVRAVYGNIDGTDCRAELSDSLYFSVDKTNIFMTHIGGYPGKYEKIVRDALLEKNINIVVCGHSHILKVLQGQKEKVLHINPGAIGKHGFHSVRTMIFFEIENNKPQNMSVIEFERR